MKFIFDLQASHNDPSGLESLYQTARQAGEEAEFRADLLSLYTGSSDNLLYAAWHFRFQNTPLPKVRRGTNWIMAAVLGAITGLIFWLLSDISSNQLLFLKHMPYLVLLWAPIASLLTLVFLTITSRKGYWQSVVAGTGLALACIYIVLIAPGQESHFSSTYLDLMAVHLPLLAWIALGLAVLGWSSHSENRFAFLIKSLEVAVTAGLYLIAGVVFGGITLGLFAALNITPPDLVIRLIGAGGFGLLPVLAVASVYDPHISPEAQDFSQGLSRFIFTMMRLLLPLTLLVLVIYVCFVPFNFMAPFEARDVLIVYNLMLFAIMGLLVSVTPLKGDDLSPRLQSALRKGILAVAGLAVVVSLYALAAVIYRTALGGITINRLTIIGWNGINIGILIALLFTQFTGGYDGWDRRLRGIISQGAIAYLAWTAFLVVAIPLFFR